MTRAPRATAQAIPSATAASQMSPSSFMTLTGITTTPGATPDTPRPLPDAAAMIPATCVPWPSSSVGSRSPDPVSIPGTRRPFRSGWARSTPESRTATTISGRPRVIDQALRAPMASGPHWAVQ